MRRVKKGEEEGGGGDKRAEMGVGMRAYGRRCIKESERVVRAAENRV